MKIEIEEAELKKGKERIEEEILKFEKQVKLLEKHIEQLQKERCLKKEQEFRGLWKQLMEYERELKVCVQKMEMCREQYLDAEEEIIKIMWNMKRIM